MSVQSRRAPRPSESSRSTCRGSAKNDARSLHRRWRWSESLPCKGVVGVLVVVRMTAGEVKIAEILENIRRDCRELGREPRNEGNERQVRRVHRTASRRVRGDAPPRDRAAACVRMGGPHDAMELPLYRPRRKRRPHRPRRPLRHLARSRRRRQYDGRRNAQTVSPHRPAVVAAARTARRLTALQRLAKAPNRVIAALQAVVRHGTSSPSSLSRGCWRRCSGGPWTPRSTYRTASPCGWPHTPYSRWWRRDDRDRAPPVYDGAADPDVDRQCIPARE